MEKRVKLWRWKGLPTGSFCYEKRKRNDTPPEWFWRGETGQIDVLSTQSFCVDGPLVWVLFSLPQRPVSVSVRFVYPSVLLHMFQYLVIQFPSYSLVWHTNILIVLLMAFGFCLVFGFIGWGFFLFFVLFLDFFMSSYHGHHLLIFTELKGPHRSPLHLHLNPPYYFIWNMKAISGNNGVKM